MTPAHHAIVLLFLFGVGASVGSFLNVCIYRIPARMNLLWPRSRCPRCSASIAARDNVPILGWLMLRGRCRSCGLPISGRYPFVESLVGVLYAAAYPAVLATLPRDLLDSGTGLAAARLLLDDLLIALLITAAFIGHDTGHVPRRLTVAGLLLGLALGTAFPGARPGAPIDQEPAVGFAIGAVGWLLGATLARLARRAARRAGHVGTIGRDDVDLLAMIGAFLGWQGAWPIWLLVLVLVVLRAVAASRRRAPSTSRRFPLSPSIGAAALILILLRPWLGFA